MSVSMINALNGYGPMSASAGQDSQTMMSGSAFPEIFDKTETAATKYAFQQIDAQSVVEALAEAEMTLQTVVTVRDRVVGAYQELLRMPL